MQDARPEDAGADERINVFTLSAINGGDRSDTSQGVDKVNGRLVHRLCETNKLAKSVSVSQMRGEKRIGKRSEVGKQIRTNRSKFD